MNDAVQIWEAATGKLLRELSDRKFLSFSPDGQLIALSRIVPYPKPGQRKPLTPIERLGGTELLDAKTATRQSEFIGRSFIGFALNGRAVLMTYGARASYLPPQMELWNARQRALQPIRKIDIEGGDPVLSPDGRFVVLGPSKSAPPPPPAPPRDGRSANSQVETKDAKEIILFDLQNGKVRRVRSEHKLPISHIAFSGDGSAIITTDTHGRAIIWDTQSGQSKTRLEDIEIYGPLIISVGGQTAVTPGANIFHFDTGKFIKTVFSPGDVRGAFSANDQSVLLTTGSPLSPEPLFQWDLKTLQLKSPTKKEDGEEKPVSTISPDGRLKAVWKPGAETVQLQEAETGKVLHSLGGHEGLIGNVIFSPDGQTAATVVGLPEFPPDNEEREILEAASAMLRGMKINEVAIVAKTYSENATTIIADLKKLLGKSVVRLWDIRTGQLKHTLECDGIGATARWHPDGSKLITLSFTIEKGELAVGKKALQVWGAQTGQAIRQIDEIGGARLAILSPDGLTLLSYDQSRSLSGWDTISGERKWTYAVALEGLVHSPEFAPDSRVIALAVRINDKLEIRLLDAQTGMSRHKLSADDADFFFTPDGGMLINKQDSGADYWDVASGKLLWKNEQMRSDISHNGKLVVSVNDSGQVEIREAPGGRLLVTLEIITSDPSKLSATDWIAFTPEGYYSASPSAARFIRWRVGDKLLPAEAYAQEFNRPDLVQKALQAQ